MTASRVGFRPAHPPLQAFKPLGQILLFAGLLVIASGCGNKPADVAGSGEVFVKAVPDPIDLSVVRKAFESADPALRVFLDETIGLIRGGHLVEASEQCQKLATNPGLTLKQKESLQGLQVKLQELKSGKPAAK
jgi:hypothetical protein